MRFELSAFFLDAAFSLLGAWAFVALAAPALRRSPGLAKTAALLPLAKVVVDAARPAGANAFVHTPYIGSQWDQGRFQLGGGVSAPFLPFFTGHLEGRVGSHWYALSGGEFLAHGISRGAGKGAIAAVATVLTAVCVWRVARRVATMVRFEWTRRRVRAAAEALAVVRVGFRRVDVYVDAAFHGTPFTGGAIHPYVCVPADARAAVTEPELRAALEHELAHVRAWDAPLFAAAGLLADVVWFVPGIRRLESTIRALGERAADAAAVERGADPVALASAVVRLAELGGERATAVGFTTPGESVAHRVETLLDGAPSRPTRIRRALRWAAFVAVAHAALASRFVTHV